MLPGSLLLLVHLHLEFPLLGLNLQVEPLFHFDLLLQLGLQLLSLSFGVVALVLKLRYVLPIFLQELYPLLLFLVEL